MAAPATVIGTIIATATTAAEVGMAVRATVAMIATTTIATAAAPVFISGFDERSAASVAGAIGGSVG